MIAAENKWMALKMEAMFFRNAGIHLQVHAALQCRPAWTLVITAHCCQHPAKPCKILRNYALLIHCFVACLLKLWGIRRRIWRRSYDYSWYMSEVYEIKKAPNYTAYTRASTVSQFSTYGTPTRRELRGRALYNTLPVYWSCKRGRDPPRSVRGGPRDRERERETVVHNAQHTTITGSRVWHQYYYFWRPYLLITNQWTDFLSDTHTNISL
jgi:hypothetical protein